MGSPSSRSSVGISLKLWPFGSIGGAERHNDAFQTAPFGGVGQCWMSPPQGPRAPGPQGPKASRPPKASEPQIPHQSLGRYLRLLDPVFCSSKTKCLIDLSRDVEAFGDALLRRIRPLSPDGLLRRFGFGLPSPRVRLRKGLRGLFSLHELQRSGCRCLAASRRRLRRCHCFIFLSISLTNAPTSSAITLS